MTTTSSNPTSRKGKRVQKRLGVKNLDEIPSGSSSAEEYMEDGKGQVVSKNKNRNTSPPKKQCLDNSQKSAASSSNSTANPTFDKKLIEDFSLTPEKTVSSLPPSGTAVAANTNDESTMVNSPLIPAANSGNPPAALPPFRLNKESVDPADPEDLIDVNDDHSGLASMEIQRDPIPTSDVKSQHASCPIADLKKPDESLKAFLNRMRFYLNDNYPEFFVSSYIHSLPANSTDEPPCKIFVAKFMQESAVTALCDTIHEDLKLSGSEEVPTFHSFDLQQTRSDL